MSQKNFRVPIDTVEDYLQIHRGIFGLTDEECRILAEFIRVHYHIKENKLMDNPFSTTMRKYVASRLGREKHSTLNNYIKSMKDKKALLCDKGAYEVHQILMPTSLSGEEVVTVRVSWRGQ